MKVLMVAAEGYPFVKTGGLGDVIGALPKALKKEGLDVRVVLPKYGLIHEGLKEKIKFKTSFEVKIGWKKLYCGIEELDWNGVHYYFIDNQYYFNRERIYGFDDEAEIYAFYCRGVLDMLAHIDFKPDLIHCHDWHAALISVFLKTLYLEDEAYKNIKTVMTIHNLKYQGVFPREVLEDVLGLDDRCFTEDQLEFYGKVNLLKGGIIFSDMVTTVSKSYAEEIKTPDFGENLNGVLAKRGNIRGIVNGLDYEVFNPLKDKDIFVNYKTSYKTKQKNKVLLQEHLGLEINKDIPMIAIISRLVPQKGLDLIENVIPEILKESIQFVIQGTGDYKYEEMFKDMARKSPKSVSANIIYDESLAHKIYAASDLMLMPSKFEPCGITQLIALKYGSIPLVRETGGLKDTIQSFNEVTGEGNGFTFANYNAYDMLYTLKRAIGFYENGVLWAEIVKKATKQNHSWERAAKEYADLYNEVLK